MQQVQIASWLVRQGYSVSFVTLDHGQPDAIVVDGVRILKAYSKEDGIRGLRFFRPRWSGLWAAMSRANADVYYQRTAECETGQVALWCRLHRRGFIFAAASDSDCEPSLKVAKSWTDLALYRIGLHLANCVTVQTTTQQTLLRQNMKVGSVLVRNCGWSLAESPSCEPSSTGEPGPARVLWVGRISEEKRLEWLLDVAEQCPDVMFDVVGASRHGSSYGSALIARAAGISNVRMYGWVPHAEMGRYYQRCSLLCCTSAYEGFPNTFVEAWSLGIPVVSTFDPDGVIAAYGLGWVVRDKEEIIACLDRIRQVPGIRAEASIAARRYYLENHTPEACLPVFKRILSDLRKA